MIESQLKSGIKSNIYLLIVLAGGIIITPFLLFPSGYKILALLILPVVWLIRRYLVGAIVPRTPLDWPVFLMLVMVLVSMWATPDLAFSIGKIAGVLLGVYIYYAVVDLSCRNHNTYQAVVAAFVAGGMVLALGSLFGMRITNKFPLVAPLIKIFPNLTQQTGQMGFNPNEVAGILILFIPLQLSWLWLGFSNLTTQKTLAQVIKIFLGVLAFVITLAVLILTQSRGALGGLVVGLVGLAAIKTRWGKGLAILLAIVVIVVINSGLVEQLVSSEGVETELVGTVSLDGRLEIWSRALYGIADFPFTGMGMNMFRRVMPILYPTFLIPATSDMGHAHNHFLQAALDLGIPGLIAYLGLWLGIGAMLAQVIRQKSPSVFQTMALGLSGSFIAYLVYGITDTVALGAKPGFVFWWALGLVVATFIYTLQVSSE